ncbi:MAG: hypothetical protein M3Y27_12200 [Acidobacteriota bacterium]|nr:hypothetical protein [Acidobacteriota bacterium]
MIPPGNGQPQNLDQLVETYVSAGCIRVQLLFDEEHFIDGVLIGARTRARGAMGPSSDTLMVTPIEISGEQIQRDFETRVGGLALPQDRGRVKVGGKYYAFDSLSSATGVAVTIHLLTDDPGDVTLDLL